MNTGFWVLMAAAVKISIACNIMPCNPVKVNRPSEETHHLYLHGRRVNQAKSLLLLRNVGWLSLEYTVLHFIRQNLPSLEDTHVSWRLVIMAANRFSAWRIIFLSSNFTEQDRRAKLCTKGKHERVPFKMFPEFLNVKIGIWAQVRVRVGESVFPC
jgi:hypothetical protein